MVQMVINGQFQTGQTALDVGITDLMVMEQDGVSVLYATSGQNGGLSSFELSSTGAVSILDTALYNTAWANAALSEMSLMEVNGAMSIAVAGSGTDQLYVYAVHPNGTFGEAQQMSGISTALSQLLEVSQVNAQTVYMADAGSGLISAYSIDASGGLSQAMQLQDTNAIYGAEVMAIQGVQVQRSEYVISASQSEKGVSVFRIDGEKLVNTGNAGVNEGLGIMTPTDMKVVEVGGRSFVILASAPNDGRGQSGAITVLELAQDGSLVDTDHIIDTSETHFGNVQSLEVVEADGRTYVMAGGGDDGVTLFVVMPNGRLQMLGTVSGDAGLENITTMAAHFSKDTLHLFVASEAAQGVTEITVDIKNQGEIIEASHGGETLAGTAGDDIIVGGAGNDTLRGGAGDDLIEDGLGVDTLHGGDGADLFILRSDFTHDVIEDFQAGIDRLDLSSWPFLYAPAQIGYTATANGAILDWRGETLELISRDGQTLSFAQIQTAILQTANRVPNFDNSGSNDGDQLLDGTAIDDAIIAGSGNDTVSTFAGDDYVDAGDGNDEVYTGIGNDTVYLGNNRDYVETGEGRDLIYGGRGMDTLWGGRDGDTIFGGDGIDSIRGGQGHDLIYGGQGRDFILGDNSNDTIYGEGDNDRLRGGNGDDLMYGGDGNDRIHELNGNDTIYGGDGHDTVHAGNDEDYIDGGAGNDRLFGRSGLDTLVGGEGNDYLTGNFNADLFLFGDGHGQDTISDFNALIDREKIEFTTLSSMNSWEQVAAAATQQGAHVLIDTGNGNLILLENVQLSDLDASDFIF